MPGTPGQIRTADLLIRSHVTQGARNYPMLFLLNSLQGFENWQKRAI